MPGQSRHSKKPSRKAKAMQRAAAPPREQYEREQEVIETARPAAIHVELPVQERPRTPEAAAGAASYKYIAAEIKRIGVFSGIILVILILLAVFLP